MVFDRVVMTFKIFNMLCPEGFQIKFIRSSLSSYNTRDVKNLHGRKLKLEHNNRSFLYTASLTPLNM